MKLAVIVMALVAAAPCFAAAQTTTWSIDPAHSEVDFQVRHMSVSNVHGRFGGLKGAVQLNDADISKSSVMVTIDTTTLDTGVTARDNDVKGTSFFDVAKYPTASYTSTSVSKAGDHLTVAGNLTLHGITRPVTLDVEGPSAPQPGMDHKPHSGFSATATISRKDFGLGPNYPASVIGDEIKLTIDVEVVKQ